MSNHDYFRELCALAAIGQLSADEDRELSQHLCACESCREANAEYSHVVQRQLPQADPIRWRFRNLLPKPQLEADLRDRFLARAWVEGAEFSVDALRAGNRLQGIGFRKRRIGTIALAGAAISLIALLSVQVFRLEGQKTPAPTDAKKSARLEEDNRTLHKRLSSLQESIDRQAADLAGASKTYAVSQQTLQRREAELADTRVQLDRLSARLEEQETKESALANDAHQKDLLIDDLRAKNAAVRKENVENLSARIIAEGQVRDLNESTKQQAVNFEEERQLMAASKDVRQLMGARNLHIMDVHDTDGGGKAAKAFGRVFYAEGQSLVFYAFDLPNGKLTPAKYTFQAWGQNEATAHSIRNLGAFTIDDHEQRRWVLKVNDPKLLKGIDSVFVTAEALGDAGEPRGKKLLYAYIVGEPNHP